MTEAELRGKVVATAQGYLGTTRGDGRHLEILRVYNGLTPLPRGYAVKPADAWCATFVSAVAVLAGTASFMPLECGCGDMIDLYRKLGRWVEDDGYRPGVGDVIFYDWGDAGKGDCTGWPDHVGIVCRCDGRSVRVIEGNKGAASVVGYRDIDVGGRYIRGYGAPDYASAAGRGETPQSATGGQLPSVGEPGRGTGAPLGGANDEKEDDGMTKEDVAGIVREVLRELEAETNAKPVAEWGSEAWARLTVNKIVDGSRPQAPMTRQEFAVSVCRMRKEGA